MFAIKMFSGRLILSCSLLIFLALAGRTYAVNPDQRTTTTGQILTIEISESISGQIAPGGLVTLTGYVTLHPSQWQSVLTATQPTGIDHVEVQVDQGVPITATLDGLGNWAVVVNDCTSPSTTEATVVAQDGTRVTADFIRCGPPALPTVPEPAPPAPLDKFIFLPVVAAQ